MGGGGRHEPRPRDRAECGYDAAVLDALFLVRVTQSWLVGLSPGYPLSPETAAPPTRLVEAAVRVEAGPKDLP
jgi:hypothetical protein